MNDAREQPAGPEVQVVIPSATIVRLLAWAFAVWAFVTLWRELSLCMLALLVALAVEPIVAWAQKRGYRRGAVVAGLGAATVVVVVCTGLLALPPLVQQVGQLIDDYTRLEQHFKSSLAGSHPMLQRMVAQVMELPRTPDATRLVKAPIEWGKFAVFAVGSLIWVFVLSLYMLIDGRRAYAWLLAYLPRAERDKAAETIPETSVIVAAYMRGQMITSLLCGAFALITLSLLKVPAAVPLAMLACVADILPVVGFLILAVPSVMVAFTVSPGTAGKVAGLFMLYHAVENYLIVPRVYGDRLRLSTLAVLLALMVGAVLDGVLGAILILPLVAVYPIFERIWGPDILSDEVVEDHAALDASQGHKDKDEETVQAVIDGEDPPAPEPAAT